VFRSCDCSRCGELQEMQNIKIKKMIENLMIDFL